MVAIKISSHSCFYVDAIRFKSAECFVRGMYISFMISQRDLLRIMVSNTVMVMVTSIDGDRERIGLFLPKYCGSVSDKGEKVFKNV